MKQKIRLVQSALFDSAQLYPEKIAAIQGKERVCYQELANRSHKISKWLLAHDLAPGDRVALFTDRACDYVAAYFGILAAGGIVVALNTQTSPKILSTILTDSGCCIVLSQRKQQKYSTTIENQKSVRLLEQDIPSLWQREDRGGESSSPVMKTDDIAQIIYTSGTTGKPKGVMLSHCNLMANTASVVDYLQLSRRDTVMAVLPFFYSYGNSILLTHIAVGGTLVVNQSFLYPNVILDQMIAEDVTGFSGVPSSFAILLNRSGVRKYAFPKLRYLTVAGAAMPEADITELAAVFPGCAIFIMYGQTEASARLSYLPPERIKDKLGSIGSGIPGVTLELCRKNGSLSEIGELGEIVASGQNIMAGYWQQPEATKEVLKNNRLWTGDLARTDADGFFFIESRKSDMIKTGSHRIAPKEIEDVIRELPSVKEVAVVGRADTILGEKIVAFLVTSESLSEKELSRYCRQKLPVFKVPKKFYFKTKLPKTSSGKVKRGELQDG